MSSRIWDKEAEIYQMDAEKSPDYMANFLELERVIGKNLRGLKILEVGSGSGTASAYLASKGARLHLVDISRKSLEFQKKYFKTKRLSVIFYLQDAFAMKFPKDNFDVVWNGGVIEHFPDEKKVKMIKIMWDLVKPGGKLIIIAPNKWDIPFMVAKQILIWRKKWAFGFEDDLSASKLAGLAKQAGVNNYYLHAYNPIVGWWFFPGGREITNWLGINTVYNHRRRSLFGHAIILTAEKF